MLHTSMRAHEHHCKMYGCCEPQEGTGVTQGHLERSDPELKEFKIGFTLHKSHEVTKVGGSSIRLSLGICTT